MRVRSLPESEEYRAFFISENWVMDLTEGGLALHKSLQKSLEFAERERERERETEEGLVLYINVQLYTGT